MRVCPTCQEEKHSSEFYRAGSGRRRATCRGCYAPTQNPRINAISAIAYKRVGGSPDFYALTPELRKRVRRAAAEIYDARIDIAQVYGPADAEFRRKHRSGFVYGVVHPAFPSWVKVGMTTDPERRLDGYQTGVPERDYDMPVAAFFEDRIIAERAVHDHLQSRFYRKGEWFKAPLHAVEEAIQQAA